MTNPTAELSRLATTLLDSLEQIRALEGSDAWHQQAVEIVTDAFDAAISTSTYTERDDYVWPTAFKSGIKPELLTIPPELLGKDVKLSTIIDDIAFQRPLHYPDVCKCNSGEVCNSCIAAHRTWKTAQSK